ncbi:MAG: VirB4 family type IV secretion/conjugal transfer ATPase [Alphaproteobacteria bacterium]
MILKPLKRREVSKATYAKREVFAADFIPYEYHWDRDTIITKNKELLQIIKVEGFSFETADDDVVDMKKMVRNSLYKSMAEGTFALWFHMVRRRQSVYPGGTQPPGFASHIDDKWRAKHQKRHSFVNELYITVVRKHDTKGAAKIENLFSKVEQRATKGAEALQLKEMHKELKESVYRVMATFKDYGARVLTTKMTEYGPHSEPLEFLGRLVNAGDTQKMLVPTIDIAHYLPLNRLYFGQRAIEIRSATGTKYAGLVSIKEYSPATAAGIMDAFLQLPFEFVVSQSFQFENRQTNIGSMQLQQRRMKQSQDVALSQVSEIDTALDLAMSGHIAFGMHHMTVLCFEDNLNALEGAVSMVIAEMVNVGINPVREKLVLEQCFWAQLPANFEYIGRKSKINTLNIAGFAAMHNYPPGRESGNHWGDAVTLFDTTSGTPYFFNFHLRDVGHTTIIGPTGAGKTVLMNFLCAQARKFNCRMFLFDKDRGAEIFVRALGGKYTNIDPGAPCHFNPLQLDDTMENRAFLTEWIAALVSTNDEPPNADELEIIQRAVEGNYKLRKEDRVLHNIAPFFGLEGPGTVGNRLKQWHSDGRYCQIFDHVEDVVDFHSDTVFGFEMGALLANRTTLVPVLLYLFHRIQLSLDGTPNMIILDEAWALVDNKVFAAKIKDWLKTLRKLNGMVVFATQSVEDAVNSSISDTLIQQTATQIFLPNPKATEPYRKAFMLSEREFTLLKNTDPGTRYFLVKQGKDIVVARIDLSGMDDIIAILSGRAETVAVLDEVLAELGEDAAPDVWIPVFLERVKRL